MVCGVAWLRFKCVCSCTDTCMDIIIVKHNSCHMLVDLGTDSISFKAIPSIFCQCFHADAAG